MASELTHAKSVNLFPVPLMSHIWSDAEELNADLRQNILAHEQKTRGVSITNAGGWHSEIGQLEFCGHVRERLVRHMYTMADEATRRLMVEYGHRPSPMGWTLQAWANVNRAGDFNKAHTHPDATWSGTYYVDDGEPGADAPNGTPIHFFDPLRGRSKTFMPLILPISMSLRPEPGMMILFPSYLPHAVSPHRGSRPRISIAFNLRREPYP
jgi:uncharacterized protein (TIGR02466 family)